MASIKEVLSKVMEGETVETVSKELGVRESTLRAMIDFMVEKDYLKEIQCGGGCVGCSTSGRCNVPVPRDRKIKMYALTNKGMEYIKHT